MYKGYSADGIAWETPSFATLYRVAVRSLRYDGIGAVIICNADGRPFCALWRGFGHTFTWRGHELALYRGLLWHYFQRDSHSRYCWNEAGME